MATNRINGEYLIMAHYDTETNICSLGYDYQKHRMHLNDTYNISDDVMAELVRRGCVTIRFTELNRPNVADTKYEVKFADWYSQPTIDYGFGSGIQYPLPASYVRRTKVVRT